MARFYPRMKSMAERLLKKFGMPLSLQRITPPFVDDDGIEHSESTTQFSSVGVITEYKPYEIDGTTILAGDVKVIFDGSVEIKTGDLVTVSEKTYRIISPNPVSPAGAVIVYKAQAR